MTTSNGKQESLFSGIAIPKIGYPEVFEKLWKVYPNPKSKVRTFQLCSRMVQRGEATWAVLTLAALNYGKEVAGKQQCYIQHASTFYGPSGRWLDYCEAQPDGSKEHPFVAASRKHLNRG